jgi:hypothetical protein
VPIDEAAIGDFAGSVAQAAITGFELVTVELGIRRGLYEAMTTGASTERELAAPLGIDARCARERLEQQAAAAIVHIDGDKQP